MDFLFQLLVSFFLIYDHITRISIKYLSIEKLKTLTDFGLKSAVSGVLFYIMDWGDKFMINQILDTESVGIYSLGYRLGLIMNTIINNSFSLVWTNLRMQINKSHNFKIITYRLFRIILFLSFLIITFFIFFGENFLGFFIDKNYSESFKIVPIIMISFLIYGLVNVFDYGLIIEKKMNYFIIIALFSILINISLNLIFLPIYGFYSAAYTTLFTYLFYIITIIFFSKKYFDFAFNFNRIYPVVIFTCLNYWLSLKFDFQFLLKLTYNF